MSVLTNLVVTPNRVAIVSRFVAQRGEAGISRADLRAFLAPRSLRNADSDATAETVIREACSLGVIVEDGEGVVRSGPAVAITDDPMVQIERILMEPALAEEAGQLRFGYALAWFLTCDPAQPLAFTESVTRRVADDCGDDINSYDLTNAARFQNFVYWARALGYTWRLGVDDRSDVVIPDPTAALRRHLPPLLRDTRALPLRDLLPLWSSVCPVLEGGAVRTEVEARLPLDRRRPEGELSPATTLALVRLEAEGLIMLERRADAPVLIAGRPISHLSLR